MENCRIALGVLAILVATGLCACHVSKSEYLVERDGRVASEARARAAEQRLEDLRRQIVSLEVELSKNPEHKRRVELEHRVANLHESIKRIRTSLEKCQQDLSAALRPKPWIKLAETRIWKKEHQVYMAAVQELVEQQLPLIEHCYRKHGFVEQGAAPLAGAIWVLYGIGGGWPREPRIEVSTFGDLTGYEYTKDPLTEKSRAAQFQECVRDVFANSRQPDQSANKWGMFHSSMIRIAQLLIFADTPASANAIDRPRFNWPWEEHKQAPTKAKKGEVCGYGERHRYKLVPVVNRPCAKGLRCCYPCGTRGCDSICMPSCPQGLP